MAVQVDLSMKKFEEFSEEMAWFTNNLSKTATVFEEIVTPIAKESGSELLMGVAQDAKEISEELAAKSVTAKRTNESLKEYTSKLDKMNRL